MSDGKVFFKVAVFSLLLLWTTTVEAQLNRGILEGTVTDPTGAVVPGVEVTVTSTDTNVSVITKTNGAGYYRAADLVPGKQEKVFEGAEEPYFDPDASKRTYAYMVTDAVPKLLKSGLSKKEIDTFLVDNPRRFFCGL